MADVLARICADKRAHVAQRKQVVALRRLEELAAAAGTPRGFLARLVERKTEGRFGLIAEIKKASPSKGLIRADFDVPSLARAYAAGGATCLSVLTDRPYFQGDDAYLEAAREATDLPVLRKDFMLDPYQIVEARALGADCVLLIMAALDDAEARDLESTALDLGMDVLIEVHDRGELERALQLRSPLIGVNNRNLKTLEIDLGTTETLAGMVGQGRHLVAESGLYAHDDLLRLARAGATSFLVGESLMRQADVTRAVHDLLGDARIPAPAAAG
ncbi:MAG: indole-3-glycerol phosphate synthase TrpC [Azospirillaceae bacterium]